MNRFTSVSDTVHPKDAINAIVNQLRFGGWSFEVLKKASRDRLHSLHGLLASESRRWELKRFAKFEKSRQSEIVLIASEL